MLIDISAETYQAIIAFFTGLGLTAEDYGNYIGSDDQGYWVDYEYLVNNNWATEIDGAVYLISLRPSQKGMFIGNL